jgi:hypothetical protein
MSPLSNEKRSDAKTAYFGGFDPVADMRLPGIDIHSDFERQPALPFIGTSFAVNRIRYAMAETESIASQERQVDGDWSLRINSFAEFYPSLFPAPAHQLVYLSSESLAWSAL